MKTPSNMDCKNKDLASVFDRAAKVKECMLGITAVRLQVEQIQLVANIAQVVIAVHLLKCL
jgi:hypothetical protein